MVFSSFKFTPNQDKFVKLNFGKLQIQNQETFNLIRGGDVITVFLDSISGENPIQEKMENPPVAADSTNEAALALIGLTNF